MGRKTYESIGRPLPGRRNIVITRNPEFTAAGCDIVGDMDTALEICGDADEVMLIGGASLYAQAIEMASVMYVTRIQHSFSGDTWFPEFDLQAWREVERQDFAAGKDSPYACSFVKYVQEI
jgi:dihydrofolate reductase